MARDGHEFSAYLASPAAAARGAVVVLQEIFGVNEHIRGVAEQYAAAGFLTIAPALFDRIGRNIELGYGPKDMEQGTGYRLQITDAKALLDIGAAVNVVRHAGRVALVGYCWGGQTVLDRRRRPAGAGRGRLLHQPRLGKTRARARLPDHVALWRARPEHSRPSASSRCGRHARRRRSSCTRRITASTARRAPAMTRRAPRSPGNGHRNSSRST